MVTARFAQKGGGQRGLGIPNVVDRVVQQAVLQVLSPQYEPTFHASSHGFRPRRSCHTAIAEATQYLAQGYEYVVDLDLEKFFDTVHHQRLLARLSARVTDVRVLKLIHAMLKAKVVMPDGVVVSNDEGTSQGGRLSPLLSNIVLDELDLELAQRGHKFVRYADDCNIYVRSRRAGERVMVSIEGFLRHRLKLRINTAKSAVARPSTRKFLGFSFTAGSQPRRRIAPQALARFKAKLRDLTRRTRGATLAQSTEDLSRYLIGWRGYFGVCQTPSVLQALDEWTRRRLRAIAWKQWKRGRARFAELRQHGVGHKMAAQTAGSAHGPWRLSKSPTLHAALSKTFFRNLGLASLAASPTA